MERNEATSMTPPSDVEITMHLFRLMRSGNYMTAKQVLEACEESFPDVEKQRIRACASDLARRLIENG